MSNTEDARQALEEKILSKQQQIDFEKKNLDYEAVTAWENRENPSQMEEAKNFSDPVESALDSGDLKSLRNAERELNELLKQLDDLNRS